MSTDDKHAPSQRRAVWPPSEGFFRMRLAPRAWPVPARIARDADGCWFAVIDGKELAHHADPARAPRVADIWICLRIDEAEYHWLNAIRDHAAAHGPEDHPAINPLRAILPQRLQPLIPRTPT